MSTLQLSDYGEEDSSGEPTTSAEAPNKSKEYNPDTDTILSIYRTETIYNKDGTPNSTSRIVTNKTDTIKKSEVKDYDPVKGGHTVIQK